MIRFQSIHALVAGEERRAASPVIGVILMVAITVILSSLIGTFVIGTASDVKNNPQVGVTFEETASGDVVITVNSIQQADRLEFSVDDSGTWSTITATVGETATASPSEKVTVRASYRGNTVVIDTYSV